MGSISTPTAIYGLQAIGTPTKTQVAGTATIGVSQASISLTGATKAYCVSATLATAGNTLTIDTATGIATIGTAPVSQVETATVVAASGATSSGNLAVTVTGARITGSPLAFSVALVTGVDTTATLIAAKIRTAFNANTALTSVYTVGGTGANVTLTETSAQNNDGTLNIAITAALGVSAIVSSTNTTTGVGGVKLTNNTGDGKDFEGVSLGTMIPPTAILIRSISGGFSFEWTGDNLAATIVPTGFNLFYGGGGGSDIVITAATACEVEATFIA
jgi:hypothetical protein